MNKELPSLLDTVGYLSPLSQIDAAINKVSIVRFGYLVNRPHPQLETQVLSECCFLNLIGKSSSTHQPGAKDSWS